MLVKTARTLLKRWMWVALSLVLAVIAGSGVYALTPAVQQSKAQMIFVPSVIQPGVVGPTNPFLSLGGSLAIVASAVQVAVSDQQSADALAAAGATAKYEVLPNLAENAGPVLLITVTNTNATNAQRTMNAVIALIESKLADIQTARKVSTNLFITSVILTATSKSTAVHKAQLQRSVLVALGSLALLVALILLFERRRKDDVPGESSPGESGPANGRSRGDRFIRGTADEESPVSRSQNRHTVAGKKRPSRTPDKNYDSLSPGK